MRIASMLALVLALAGCTASRERALELSSLNADQLTAASDQDLCNRRAQSGAIDAERSRRGLADCSPAAIQCKQMGFAPGTQPYLVCRQQVAAQEESRRDRLARIFARPSPSRAVCRTSFGVTTCDYE